MERLDTLAEGRIVADPWSGRPQHWHAPFPIGRDGEAEITIGYRRCRSADPSSSPGQDFAAARYDAAHVIGVVADGVGQSFHGEIAAWMVGERLLSVLWKRRHQPPDEREMAELLSQWVSDVDSEVVATPISKGLPYIEEAEREAKLQGSQTIFSAFLLETVSGRLNLYQVGDAPARIEHDGGKPEIVLAPEGGRWSSTGKADCQLRVLVRAGVKGCLIHSDGLRQGWTEETLSRGDVFESFAEEHCERDDLCFVRVQRLRKPSEVPVEDLTISTHSEEKPSVHKGEAPPAPPPKPRHARPRRIRKPAGTALRYAAAVLLGFSFGWFPYTEIPAPPALNASTIPVKPDSSPVPAPPPPPVQPVTDKVSFQHTEKSWGPLMAGDLAVLLESKLSSIDAVEFWVGGTLAARVFPREAVHPALMLRGLNPGKETPVEVRAYVGEGLAGSETFNLASSDGKKKPGWHQLALDKHDGS